MSYPESVHYLYALGNELKAGAKFGLERMQALLRGLNNPERRLPCVHIAGTNGKGSTSVMVATVLAQAGYRTGLYTSPHLISPTERIQINNSPVSGDDFTNAFETVHQTAEDLLKRGLIDVHPSYFETVTAMALVIFSERCEISVLEVGLGGRLDATNVVFPLVCAITSIAFDHETFLGFTIELIAGEKAGILKPGVPVVLSRQPFEAAETVVLRHAQELNSLVIRAADFTVSDLRATPLGSTFDLEGTRYRCPLPGRHQVENAVTAILVCRNLGVRTEDIQSGLERTLWPGRLEYVAHEPDFVLDGAHNPAGAGALCSYIEEFCSDRPVWIVYAAMRDKAIEEVTSRLFPLADRLILTAPDFPRALRPEAIAAMTEHPDAVIAPTVFEAIHLAKTASQDAIVFFTGSLFLVGEVRAALLPHLS